MTIDVQLGVKSEPENLPPTITFDDSALTELERMSGEYWPLAKVYAAIAAANAEREKKEIVSSEDVQEAVNSSPTALKEAMEFTLGRNAIKDDEVLKGTLYDAPRVRKALEARRTGQLPSNAVTDLIDFSYGGLSSPFAQSPVVRLPFLPAPFQVEVRAVAEHFARFVAERTGEPREVVRMPTDYQPASYIIRSLAAGEKRDRLYRVTRYPRWDSKGQLTMVLESPGEVIISREEFCGRDPLTLEAYVQAVKSQPGGKDKP